MENRIFFNGIVLSKISPISVITEKDVKDTVYEHSRISPNEYYILHKGKKLQSDEMITADVECILRCLGGKGGFGSMLRAIGAQIEKTTNREACRDLSGRRLRDINEEKRLKAWLDKQKERENEAEEKRKRKLERLVAVPKHEFKDSDYENARSELTEKVSEAVQEGFKKAALKPVDPVGIKRKATDSGNGKAKKAALWIGDDLSSSTSDDSDSDSENESKASNETPSSKLEDKECDSAEDFNGVRKTEDLIETTTSESNENLKKDKACESEETAHTDVSNACEDHDKSPR